MEILLKSAEAPTFLSSIALCRGFFGGLIVGLATFAEEGGGACMGSGVLGFGWGRRVQADP